MKYAVHILCFNTSDSILNMIENCGKYVDKIYIAYSEVPWNYSEKARELYHNRFNTTLLDNSPYRSKIIFITGIWASEEEQRNACLERAKQDGIDYLIVQDADEYYRFGDYERLLAQIAQNPHYDFYFAPCCTFWKSWDYVLVNETGVPALTYLTVAINCGRDVKFSSLRQVASQDYHMLRVLFFHGSYVLTDEQVYEKVNTWGHTLDFDREEWYQNKWLAWNENAQNLHPTHPTVWASAKRFIGSLPEVLETAGLRVHHEVGTADQLYAYGIMFCQHSLYHDAIQYLEAYLKSELSDSKRLLEACYQLLALYDIIGESSKGADIAFQSLRYGAPRAEFCTRLSTYFFDCGDVTGAIFWSELATLIPKPHVSEVFSQDHWTWVPHYQLSAYYIHIGEFQKANWHNNEALKFSPEESRLLQNKAHLQQLGINTKQMN